MRLLTVFAEEGEERWGAEPRNGKPQVHLSTLQHLDSRIFKPVLRFHYSPGSSQVPLHESVGQNRNGFNRGLGCSSVFHVDSAENEGDTKHVVTRFWTSKHYFTTFFFPCPEWVFIVQPLISRSRNLTCQCWQTVNYSSNDEASIILTFQKTKLQ